MKRVTWVMIARCDGDASGANDRVCFHPFLISSCGDPDSSPNGFRTQTVVSSRGVACFAHFTRVDRPSDKVYSLTSSHLGRADGDTLAQDREAFWQLARGGHSGDPCCYQKANSRGPADRKRRRLLRSLRKRVLMAIKSEFRSLAYLLTVLVARTKGRHKDRRGSSTGTLPPCSEVSNEERMHIHLACLPMATRKTAERPLHEIHDLHTNRSDITEDARLHLSPSAGTTLDFLSC
ncbi:hypothetical protein HD554DRAFT_804590 [Boletus coccyginus]|nr:hypothetical protein HD554DRAFT_804590 [Boletus coccyginus]